MYITIQVAEAACLASKACVGLTYHSSELHPPSATVFKIYLKTNAGTTGKPWACLTYCAHTL